SGPGGSLPAVQPVLTAGGPSPPGATASITEDSVAVATRAVGKGWGTLCRRPVIMSGVRTAGARRLTPAGAGIWTKGTARRSLMPKVLIVTGDAAESLEVMYPYQRLLEEGYEVDIAAPSVKKLQFVVHDFVEGFDTYTE